MIDQVHWLGHASFRLAASAVIYVDPFQLNGGPRADVILITHRHHDHLSPDDIARVSGPDTVVIAPADCLAPLTGYTRMIAPGDTLRIGTVEVSAVPAYNVTKSFHPKSNGWVGYVVTVDGATVYHAGDTDVIPEMAAICADIALLPIGGTYTMTADDAAQAVRMIRPAIAIPMHYGSLVGSLDDAERFRTLVSGMADVVVKAKE